MVTNTDLDQFVIGPSDEPGVFDVTHVPCAAVVDQIDDDGVTLASLLMGCVGHGAACAMLET